jgi:hypothetical protein
MAKSDTRHPLASLGMALLASAVGLAQTPPQGRTVTSVNDRSRSNVSSFDGRHAQEKGRRPPRKRSPRTISIPALPLSVAAFCGAKKCNPCLRKVLLGQGEWPVALQDTPDRDWKE